MIKIIDNVITPTYANVLMNDARHILQYCYKDKTSEQNSFYAGSIFTDENTHDYGQLSCPIVIAHEAAPQLQFAWYFDLLRALMYNVQDIVPEINPNYVTRIKHNILLQQENAPELHYNIPHQDAERGCYSMIYYLDDSDGDTFLFNEYYNKDSLPDKLTVAHRVSPKKNRVVIFESDRYHASSNPRINKDRFVINFVFANANSR
jgi:quinol monooxygenase YgiN